jgi:phosphoadenosine phosphosulfate reductase
MVSSNVAHGKEMSQWCDRCGTLILGNKCSYCGGPGRKFEINSPGDIRPCMGDSYGILKGLFEETFGTFSPLDGRMIFFNKVPGEDRTDEIVAHGEVIGILRFDMKDNCLKIELRQPGADLFRDVATKNVVIFGNISGHLKGKSIPGENVIEVKGDFSEGDAIIVRKALKAGPGVALTSSGNMKKAEKAIRVRDLNAAEERHISPISDREIFVKVNKDHLLALESIGVSDIRSFIKGKKQPVTVSFSGGKDSLAAYGIASRASDHPGLLFIDTGLEFPETLRYVKAFAEEYGETLHIASAGNAFWDNVGTFGPPAKDFRWCCKVCKLGPITDMISRDYPIGTITVEGNRALESFARSNIGFVSKNPFVPNQTNLNPVRDWSAAEIWGYIWMRKLRYNTLYDRDFERIGCYLCASCLSSEWRNTERIHPDMYSNWEGYLHKNAEDRGLPKEYVDMGFWRWKVLPPKMVQLAEGLDLRTEPTKGDKLSLKMLKGASPCTAGGYSMEAVVSVPRNRDFSYVEDALNTIGEVKYSPDFEIILLKTARGRSKVFGGGQISVTADDAKDAQYLFERTVKGLLRAQLCTSCGICAKGCPRRAIKIVGGMRVDPKACNHCGKCERSCMVIHYYDKMIVSKERTDPKCSSKCDMKNTRTKA